MSMHAHTVSDILRQQIDKGRFPEGSEAHGLAVQVADRGMASLAPHQRSAWDSLIQPLLDDIGVQIRDIDEDFARDEAKRPG